MGYDISSGLLSMSVCFDFWSTNVVLLLVSMSSPGQLTSVQIGSPVLRVLAQHFIQIKRRLTLNFQILTSKMYFCLKSLLYCNPQTYFSAILCTISSKLQVVVQHIMHSKYDYDHFPNQNNSLKSHRFTFIIC